MGKMKSILNTFNLLSGITSRHNRALAEVKDWTESVKYFLTTYDLYGKPGFDTLLKKIGNAKFDLTSIAYNGRPMVARAKNIKVEGITKQVKDLVDNMESLRRYLMKPSIQSDRLAKGIRNLRSSFETLRDVLAKTEYM
jgi:hypothetical protein